MDWRVSHSLQHVKGPCSLAHIATTVSFLLVFVSLVQDAEKATGAVYVALDTLLKEVPF